jgi:uncharacterized cupin superfamily protein
VSVKKVNILSVELDEPLDEAGFRHVATSIGLPLGAQRIGASVYGAEAGLPIWPYHYHHGIEEWLYVIAGAPVLREPAGERILTPGDLVCFPSGHLGAHTLKGPGRFVILATGQQVEPYLSVYPDSDKVSGPHGILLRSSAVGYWHGEGTAGRSQSVEIVREPRQSLRRPVVNVPLLREGEDQLEAGDLVCSPEGPAGAHRLLNRGESVVRALFLSTTALPANVCYPDTGHWLIRNGPGRDEVAVRETGSGGAKTAVR